MKLGATATVDLSNYYTKQEVDTELSNYYTRQEVDTELSNYYTQPQVNALLPKGVRAEGSFSYHSNSSSAWYAAQVIFDANSSNVSFDSTSTAIQTTVWGDSSYWGYAPNSTALVYRFVFSSPILDENDEETDDYKVMLQGREVMMVNEPRIISLHVGAKTPNHFEVHINLQRNATNNWIIYHRFDFVVF